MTDEEIAKEWINSVEYQRDRPIEPFSTDERPNDWAELAKYAEYMLSEAFLAGLKAGRPKWHDLRKDKNDLPKVKKGKTVEREPYHISNVVQNQKGQHCWYKGLGRINQCTNEFLTEEGLKTFFIALKQDYEEEMF